MTEVKEALKAEVNPLAGPFDSVLGADALEVGQIGFASLDEAGAITGIYLVPPEPDSGVKAIRVRKQDTQGGKHHAIVSESGAELAAPLNPHPDIRFVPSDAEAYEASANKFQESRENGPKRTVGSDGTQGKEFGESPQIAGAYENRPTHSQAGRGEPGKAVAGVEGAKTETTKTETKPTAAKK